MKRFVSRLMGLRPRFLVMGLGFTYAVSSLIRQSFALDASRSDFGAFKVIHAKDRTRRSLRAGFAAALHRGQDRVHVASALAFGVAGLPADIGFVHFDDRATATHRHVKATLAQGFAKAMHHELDQVAAGSCLKINGAPADGLQVVGLKGNHASIVAPGNRGSSTIRALGTAKIALSIHLA
jgi:hypothetical protein